MSNPYWSRIHPMKKPAQTPTTDLPADEALPEDDAQDRAPIFAKFIEISSDALRPVDVATFRKALGLFLASELSMLSRPKKTGWCRAEILAVATIEAAGPCCSYERYRDYAWRILTLLALLEIEPKLGGYFNPDAETWEGVVDTEMLSYFVRYPFEWVGGDTSDLRAMNVFKNVALGDLELAEEGKGSSLLLREMMDSVEYLVGEPVPEGKPVGAELPEVPTGTPWLDDAIEHLTLLRTIDVLSHTFDEHQRNLRKDLIMTSARMARVHEQSRDVEEVLRQVLGALGSPTPPPGFEMRKLKYFATVRKIRKARPALAGRYRQQLRKIIRGEAKGRNVLDISRESLKKAPPRVSSRLPKGLRRAKPIHPLGLRQVHLILRDEERMDSDAVIDELGQRMQKRSAEAKGRRKDVRHRLEILGHALSDPRSRAWLTQEREPTMPLLCAVAELDFSAVQKVTELNDMIYEFLDTLMASDMPRMELAESILEALQLHEHPYVNKEQTVFVSLTASLELTRIKIIPRILDPADTERLGEAIRTAYMEAVHVVNKDLADVREQFARREPATAGIL